MPAPLRHPSFRRLFAASSISAVGDRLVPVALAFAVLDLTGSVTDLGIVLAGQTVPLAAAVLLGGVWADRLPRRRVMLVSDLVRAGSQGASAALLLAGAAHVWQLAALQAVYGTAEAFFAPAATAIVPETVPSEVLQPANALLGLSQQASSVLGPALAGVLVATIGPGWGLGVDALSFVGSAFCLAGLPVGGAAGNAGRRAGRGSERQPMVRELRAGWRAFTGQRWLWITVLVFTGYLGASYAPFQVLGPQIARLSLGGPGAWAALSAALGLGSVGGGLLALRLRVRHPLRFSFGVFVVVTPALIALLAARASLLAILPAALIDGASGSLFNASWFTALQSTVEPAELSRVSSWDYLGSLVLVPAGQVAAGPVAAAVGLSTTLYGAAAVALVLFAAGLAAPAVWHFRLPEGAPRAIPAPAGVAEVTPPARSL